MIRSLSLLLILSACSSPCFTAGDIEARSDCAAFNQVLAGIDQ
jgi:hypothetical protein